MRTFHFGGTATHKIETNIIESRFSGIVKFDNLRTVVDRHGRTIVLSRAGQVLILDNDGKLKDTHPIPYGTQLTVQNGAEVKAGAQLGEWDTFATPIVAEVSGKLRYRDLKGGKSLEEKVDDVTFLTRKVVIEAKGEALKPRLEIVSEAGELLRSEAGREAVYSIPVGATISYDDTVAVAAGDILAKIPKETTKTKDITGGLPRVAELFEARKPKDVSVMCDRDGTVTYGDDSKGKRKVLLTDEEGGQKEYLIQKGKHILVNEGDYVRKGDPLVDGQPNPHEILAILGRVELARFLVNEIQDVYRLQGVKINDKHIEVIVRQMLRRVRILDAGDTRFLPGEQASRVEVNDANHKAKEEGLNPATWEPLLLGITKSSLATESFISAASFQETTKVLTEAAINSRVDHLRGLKENVIMGRLIPAGTGASYYRDLSVGFPAKESPVEGKVSISAEANA
jgi:DNA-directed RNA polymerase subunit beta'